MACTVPTVHEPLALTRSDGTAYTCWVQHIEVAGDRRQTGGVRWIFADADGNTFLGPAFVAPESPERVLSLIDRSLATAPWSSVMRAASLHSPSSELR